MSRVTILTGALLIVVAAATSSVAQSNSLKGAWKVVAVTGADGKTDTAPQPGLWLFTDRHYSIQVVREPRKPLPDKPTDPQIAAAFGPYTANTGTYEVKATTLTRRIIAAKSPNVMAATTPSQDELKWEGASTVYITSGNPGGGKTVTKLQRIE